jgi:phosphatidylglycerol:prolipoprotein diacylglycerol transferase
VSASTLARGALVGFVPLMPFAYWVHDLSPFLVRFGEHVGIRYYGLAYVLGFLAAGALLRLYHRMGRTTLGFEAAADLVLALVVGVLVGGRLGFFLLYQPDTLLRDPVALVRVWDGGMASHGGFVGVVLAVWWFARSRQVPFLHATDLVVTTVPVGLFLGRIANFINGELWGKVTDVPWAVIFPLSVSPRTPLALIEPRHPSQLYEAALEGFVLLAYIQHRFWRNRLADRHPGQLSGEFLVAYAVLRMVGEAFREPDAPLILGLNRGLFYSIFVLIAGVVIAVWAARRKPTSPARPPE